VLPLALAVPAVTPVTAIDFEADAESPFRSVTVWLPDVLCVCATLAPGAGAASSKLEMILSSRAPSFTVITPLEDAAGPGPSNAAKGPGDSGAAARSANDVEAARTSAIAATARSAPASPAPTANATSKAATSPKRWLDLIIVSTPLGTAILLSDAETDQAPQLYALRQRAQDEASEEDLRMLLRGGSSLGGARPKAHVIALTGRTAIAKFACVSGDDWDVTAREAVAVELARGAGIRVPTAQLHQIDGKSVLVVERFDRDGARRIGYVSAMTMLEANGGDQRSYRSQPRPSSRTEASEHRDRRR
jgi:hypothetical protein